MSEEQKTQRKIVGRVVSDKMDKTVSVAIERLIRHGAGTRPSNVTPISGVAASIVALLLAYDPNLTPMQIASILELSATDEIAKTQEGVDAATMARIARTLSCQVRRTRKKRARTPTQRVGCK